MAVMPVNHVTPVHHNIRIHHNTIRRFHTPLIYACCVDGLVFHDNEIAESTEYPPSGADQAAVTLVGAVTGERIELGPSGAKEKAPV